MIELTAFEVLELFSSSPITIGQVAQAMECDPHTARSRLRDLERAGLLYRSSSNGLYRITKEGRIFLNPGVLSSGQPARFPMPETVVF